MTFELILTSGLVRTTPREAESPGWILLDVLEPDRERAADGGETGGVSGDAFRSANAHGATDAAAAEELLVLIRSESSKVQG